MKIRFKKLSPSAVVPRKAHASDAGLDLVAVSKRKDRDGNFVYGTGLAFEIPDGFVGLVFPRSSVSARCMTMANCVGVIDSGFRGEVTVKFRQHLFAKPYDKGDRVAQMIIMPYPHVDLVEVDELSDSDRGEGGYGSTGK